MISELSSSRPGSAFAQAVNSALVGLYWEVGHRIHAEVLKSKRANYGEEIVATLSRQLRRGFWQRIFAGEFVSDGPVRGGLSRRCDCLDAVETIGLEPLVEFIPIDDPLKREFYAEMCRAEQWSVRTLRAKIKA